MLLKHYRRLRAPLGQINAAESRAEDDGMLTLCRNWNLQSKTEKISFDECGAECLHLLLVSLYTPVYVCKFMMKERMQMLPYKT